MCIRDRFNLAKPVTRTTSRTLILNPFSNKTLLKSDKKLAHSVTGIDCSWNLAVPAFKKPFTGVARKLPPLLAGNPMNYSKLNKLSTVEALAAAVYIMGDSELMHTLLKKFKWGPTFFALNKNLLEDYSKAKSETEILEICHAYRLTDVQFT